LMGEIEKIILTNPGIVNRTPCSGLSFVPRHNRYALLQPQDCPTPCSQTSCLLRRQHQGMSRGLSACQTPPLLVTKSSTKRVVPHFLSRWASCRLRPGTIVPVAWPSQASAFVHDAWREGGKIPSGEKQWSFLPCASHHAEQCFSSLLSFNHPSPMTDQHRRMYAIGTEPASH
jgi:hypothetical protein